MNLNNNIKKIKIQMMKEKKKIITMMDEINKKKIDF